MDDEHHLLGYRMLKGTAPSAAAIGRYLIIQVLAPAIDRASPRTVSLHLQSIVVPRRSPRLPSCARCRQAQSVKRKFQDLHVCHTARQPPFILPLFRCLSITASLASQLHQRNPNLVFVGP